MPHKCMTFSSLMERKPRGDERLRGPELQRFSSLGSITTFFCAHEFSRMVDIPFLHAGSVGSFVSSCSIADFDATAFQ